MADFMMLLLTYLLAGIFAGLVAGLLGVGGGIIVVPVLILAFEAQGFSAEHLTHMAIATSLATIVFTSASSVYNHHRLGGVRWDVLRVMLPGIAGGAVAGVLVVIQLDGEWVKKLIGLFAVVVAARMLTAGRHAGNRHLPAWPVFSLVGFGIGGASTMFGIGGGTFSVPFLSRYRLRMQAVVGTAAACGMPIAVVGAFTNMLAGAGLANMPEWSIGYVYLPALFGVAAASVVFARVGAIWAHRVSSLWLKRIFALCLAIVGVRFLVS